jgi:hypothetical protein
MASKINVTPENQSFETPLPDLSDAAVKELIRNAKKRGHVTHDQINTLPPGRSSPSNSRASR